MFKSKVSLKRASSPSAKIQEFDDDLPVGIWENEDKSRDSLQNFKQLWKFNTDLSTPKDDENFVDEAASYELSWGGTGTTENATRRLPALEGIDIPKTIPKSPLFMGSQMSLFDGEVSFTCRYTIILYCIKRNSFFQFSK
jgi:hypothetical protein